MRNLTARPEWTLPKRAILKQGSDQGHHTHHESQNHHVRNPHALTGLRIPAQGANPGTPPGKEIRVLKERRTVAELEPRLRPEAAESNAVEFQVQILGPGIP